MERSESIAELVTALAKAQGEFTPAVKESDNPAFRSKYADLAAVINAVRPALNKNGITLMQTSESDLERQTASVTTWLHHKDQWLSTTAEAPAKGVQDKFNVQTLGATWTYLKRYTLQGLLGLPSEDDDGNSVASDNQPIPKKETPPKVSSEEFQSWQTAFESAATIDEFNTAVVPLMKERSNEFIKAAAKVAKDRGWRPNRATGLYEVGAAQ